MAKKKIKIERKVLKVNPVFEPLFMDDLFQPRYYNVYGGRGSGKSFIASIAIVQLTYSKLDLKSLEIIFFSYVHTFLAVFILKPNILKQNILGLKNYFFQLMFRKKFNQYIVC